MTQTIWLKKGDTVERHLDGYGLVTWTVEKENRATYVVSAHPSPTAWYRRYINKTTGLLSK